MTLSGQVVRGAAVASRAETAGPARALPRTRVWSSEPRKVLGFAVQGVPRTMRGWRPPPDGAAHRIPCRRGTRASSVSGQFGSPWTAGRSVTICARLEELPLDVTQAGLAQ